MGIELIKFPNIILFRYRYIHYVSIFATKFNSTKFIFVFLKQIWILPHPFSWMTELDIRHPFSTFEYKCQVIQIIYYQVLPLTGRCQGRRDELLENFLVKGAPQLPFFISKWKMKIRSGPSRGMFQFHVCKTTWTSITTKLDVSTHVNNDNHVSKLIVLHYRTKHSAS
jgi:hypothetical protein